MTVAAGGARLNLRQSFVVGYVAWLLPSLVRYATSHVTPPRIAYDVLSNLALFTVAVAVSGGIFGLASRRGLRLTTAAAAALLAAVPVTAVSYVVDYWFARHHPEVVAEPMVPPISISVTLATALADSLTICLFLAAILFLPAAARAHEEHRQELASARREAELLRIRSHLEPHFVLNSLNAVAGLVEEDPAQARELLAALGDLFRDAASFRATHRVGDEMEWLKRYVTIHELRHPETLTVGWDVEPTCLEVTCPALILQPLVENAIHHGALRGGGHLLIRARQENGHLTLAVEDDGPGLGGPREGGQGLAITRRRLALEGGAAEAFELGREGERTVARLRLPLRGEAGA